MAPPCGAFSAPNFLRPSKLRGEEHFKTGSTSPGCMRWLSLIIADWIRRITPSPAPVFGLLSPGVQKPRRRLRLEFLQGGETSAGSVQPRSCVRPALRRGPPSGDQGLPTALVSLARGRNGFLFWSKGTCQLFRPLRSACSFSLPNTHKTLTITGSSGRTQSRRPVLRPRNRPCPSRAQHWLAHRVG